MQDIVTKEIVAVKFSTRESQSAANNSLREAEKLALFKHSNLVRMIGNGAFVISEPQLAVCIALEYAPFGDLHNFLHFRASQGVALPFSVPALLLLA